jgi:hypothetical protein
VLVEELDPLVADGLELPERHLPDGVLHGPDQARPAVAPLHASQARVVAGPGLLHHPHHRRLAAGVLLQRIGGAGARERRDLLPVQAHELVGQLLRGERKGRARVVALEDAQVGDGVEEGVLVAGDEAALIQQPLELTEESQLLVGRRDGVDHPSGSQ